LRLTCTTSSFIAFFEDSAPLTKIFIPTGCYQLIINVYILLDGYEKNLFKSNSYFPPPLDIMEVRIPPKNPETHAPITD
jgi:hypothetical protein